MIHLKAKLLATLLIVVMLFPGFTAATYAYDTLGYTWSSSTIRYYYDSFNSTRGKSFIDAGARGWGNTDVNFISGNAGNYNLYCSETNNANVSWDGLTTHQVSGGRFISQIIQLNSSKSETWNDDGALKSVAIHEFGHSLGLDHSNGAIIMNPYTWGDNSRYGDYGISTIQPDDRNGANALY